MPEGRVPQSDRPTPGLGFCVRLPTGGSPKHRTVQVTTESQIGILF